MLTIALLQMAPEGADQEANLAMGDACCRRARAMGADIALFLEMWNIGYTLYAPPGDASNDVWRAKELWTDGARMRDADLLAARAHWQGLAIDEDSRFVRHFRTLALELEMAIAITYLQRWDGAPRNVVSLIDRHGEIAFTYAKVHTCVFSMEEACTPGEQFYVRTIDTAAGPVAIGAMICFDREFPESARILMLEGAEIILTPNACEMETHRLAQFRTRAFENVVGVALANYAAPHCNGHSIAFEPDAFDRDGRPRETRLVEAGESEGIFLAGFDLDRMRALRRREVWGNAFRRPNRYAALTEFGAQEPFIRVDALGERFDSALR